MEYDNTSTESATQIAEEASTSKTVDSDCVNLLPNKQLARNYNGTAVFISYPKNEAELQLYRVMQRASLLSYYDTLLEMGGDDVQQLCDAGEDEFLEIMALVGMASKPLHVRRFQKALQEWLTNPSIFQNSISDSATATAAAATATAAPCLLPRSLCAYDISSSATSCSTTSLTRATPAFSPNHTQTQQLSEITSCSPAIASSSAPGSTSSLSSSSCPSSPIHSYDSQTQNILDESQIKKLEEAASKLVQNLPSLEPKFQKDKKKVCKDLQAILNMSNDNPFRMQRIRKFSAIYGRFDCKRKPGKALTLHEVSVNEAAAQICKHIPALLTRREELFPLARRVVRDSGYHYSKGHSKSFAVSTSNLTKTTSLISTYKYHDNFTKNKRKTNDSAAKDEPKFHGNSEIGCEESSITEAEVSEHSTDS